MGSRGSLVQAVMPARPSDAPMTLRNPRRETESSHSDAPLGNSRCSASLNSSLPASSSSERQYSGPVFSRASWAVAASMRSRTTLRSSFFEGQTSSRFLIWISPPLFFSSFMLTDESFFRPYGTFFHLCLLPHANAVGCNLSPLRGFAIASATQPFSPRTVELRSTDSRWRLSPHQLLHQKLPVTSAAARDVTDAAHVVLL